MLESRLDLVWIDLHRKGEGALEFADAALLAQPTLARDIGLAFDVAAEAHRVRGDVDVDLIRRQPRQVGAQVIRVVRLPEIHRNGDLPGGETTPHIRPDDAVLEKTVHGVAERNKVRHWCEPRDGHGHPPYQKRCELSLARRLGVAVLLGPVASVSPDASPSCCASCSSRSVKPCICRSSFTPARFTPRTCVR